MIELFFEVTGSEKAIDVDKLRQLIDYTSSEEKERGVAPKSILVGNHQYDIEHENPGNHSRLQQLGTKRMNAKCRFYGKRAAIEIQARGPHQGEYCSNCGHWLRWIPKKVARKRIGK